jgi:hypothetical protein
MDPVMMHGGGRRVEGADVAKLKVTEVEDAGLEVIEVKVVADPVVVEMDDAYGGGDGDGRRLWRSRRSLRSVTSSLPRHRPPDLRGHPCSTPFAVASSRRQPTSPLLHLHSIPTVRGSQWP